MQRKLTCGRNHSGCFDKIPVIAGIFVKVQSADGVGLYFIR